jgi:NAD(P)-dependent dehydrogenase (short-subunit alcohol dehydrogenase family)
VSATSDRGVKCALVTGGGSGQGLAMTRRLMARGASVLICGHEDDVLQQAAEELRSLGSGRCETLTANLIDPAQAVGAVEACVAAFGGIDVLVNNAGLWETGEWGELTVEGWDRSMNLMARAPMLMIQAAIPHMAQRGGRVINNASISCRMSEHGSTSYSAAKAALVSVTESAAVDLAKRGIRVNALAPGWIRSAMSEAYLSGLEPADIANLNPIGRPGDPDEVAAVVEFLAYDAPDFITGHTIFIDGGQRVHLVQPRM